MYLVFSILYQTFSKQIFISSRYKQYIYIFEVISFKELFCESTVFDLFSTIFTIHPVHGIGFLYLHIYRKETRQTETNLKKRYEISEDNFVGTERGTIKDRRKQNVLYWAIILEDETLLFKGKENVDDTRSSFENWNEVLKQHWKHRKFTFAPYLSSLIAIGGWMEINIYFIS